MLGLGVALSVFNWVCLFASWRSGRFVSPVFPMPSVLTAIGLGSLPQTRPYWWVGLLTDYTLFSWLVAAPRLIKEAWQTSAFTRIWQLRASDSSRLFDLSLHRGGHFFLRATFEPPASCDDYGACIQSYGVVGNWAESSEGHLQLQGYGEGRKCNLLPVETGFVSYEQGYPLEKAFPYDSLDSLHFQIVSKAPFLNQGGER